MSNDEKIVHPKK